MVSHWDGCKVQHRAVNACLCPVYSVEGMHVVTVEGACQQRIASALAVSILIRPAKHQRPIVTPSLG
jgi:xanthine dehydrogenase iron-sulfur cluster and FAD-binding subunit A